MGIWEFKRKNTTCLVAASRVKSVICSVMNVSSCFESFYFFW